MEPNYTFGFDPCRQSADELCGVFSVVKKIANFITLDQAIATNLGRPTKTLGQLQREIKEMCGFYGAKVILERDQEVVITEDAEVVSVETADRDKKLLGG